MEMAKKARGTFRAFARQLKRKDPLFVAFKPHAMSDDFPDASDWGAIRRHLINNGADHEAVVGARMAWREYREISTTPLVIATLTTQRR
jgi:hypothetical protein